MQESLLMRILETLSSRLQKARCSLVWRLLYFSCCFELAVLFMGLSLFFDAINMMRKVYVEIFIHVFGVIFLCWFILDNWTYTTIWPIWFFFA